MPPIAVFDTNILVSGTGWQGNPYRCLECAVVGNAASIVTGDRRHLLPLRNYQGVTIVSATEFLAVVSTSG